MYTAYVFLPFMYAYRSGMSTIRAFVHVFRSFGISSVCVCLSFVYVDRFHMSTVFSIRLVFGCWKKRFKTAHSDILYQLNKCTNVDHLVIRKENLFE